MDVATTQEGVVPVNLNGDRKPDLIMTGHPLNDPSRLAGQD